MSPKFYSIQPRTKQSVESLSTDVKKAILNQFTENQNHHQRLFIQFLTSMLFVLAAYAFVYTNTRFQEKNDIKKNNHSDTLKSSNVTIETSMGIWPDSISVKKFNTIKSQNGNILTYGIIHLVFMYLFSQFVLTILLVMILHLGYSFRRDQVIVNRIRIESLGENMYMKLFNANFTGVGKNIINYLPNFYSILMAAIFSTQLFVYFSIYVYLNNFPNNEIFINNFFNYDISYERMKYFLSFPMTISVGFYVYYFLKYSNRVINASNIKNLSIIKVTNRKILLQISIFSLLLAATKLILYFYTHSLSLLIASFIEISNAIACLFSMYLILQSIKKESSDETLQNKKSKLLFRNLSHGFVFFICFIICSYRIYFYSKTYFRIESIHIYVFLIQSILFYGIYNNQNKKAIRGNQNSVFVKLLENEMYILIGSFLCFMFFHITGIKIVDLIYAIILCISTLLWSLSRFSSSFNLYFERRRDSQI
jgi:hypothetical protein